MRVYNYSEARQNFATVLNTALKEEVIITRKDRSKFKLISLNKKKETHLLKVSMLLWAGRRHGVMQLLS